MDKGHVILALVFTHTNRSAPNMCPLPLAAGPGCGGRASQGLERDNHLAVAPEGGLRGPCLIAALYFVRVGLGGLVSLMWIRTATHIYLHAHVSPTQIMVGQWL